MRLERKKEYREQSSGDAKLITPIKLTSAFIDPVFYASM
jgi:hypothetical protein